MRAKGDAGYILGMAKIVVKFGGSNLKTSADLHRSAEVAKAYRRPLVIVVSAFSGVTDSLARALEEAVVSLDSVSAFIAKLEASHREALRDHVSDARELAEVDRGLSDTLNLLDRLLKGVHYIGSIPEYVRDSVLSYGERLSAPVVAAVLRAAGVNAREATPETLGLLTDGVFGNASADITACAASVAKGLEGDHTSVVPGFYGMAPNGRTTIFGRGGSDYTAAVIARCIGAGSLDLWKDVDGFLSCDPRVSPDSHTIPYLSYDEAAELSYFGAKILHPRTVEPLEGDGIPIRVMNVEKFDGRIEPFTVVGPPALGDGRKAGGHADQVVKSIASTEDIAIVRLEGPGVGSRPGILARVTGRLDAAGVNISSVITAQTCINLLFKRADLLPALAALKSEANPGVLAVTPVENLALVAAVGEGIRENCGVAALVIGAVSDAGIGVLLTQAGAGPTAVYLVVRREDRELSVRAVHDACFP